MVADQDPGVKDLLPGEDSPEVDHGLEGADLAADVVEEVALVPVVTVEVEAAALAEEEDPILVVDLRFSLTKLVLMCLFKCMVIDYKF